MTKEAVIGTKEQRLTRIGGSEFATVLDINPYKKRIELVLEKAGVIANTFEGNDATRRGEALETDIIAMFEDKSGLKVHDEQKECTYETKDGSILPLVCHCDGITNDGAVFEAKTTDINSKTWVDGIPEYYKAQLEFNCFLSNSNKAYIAVGYCKENEIIDFKYYEYIPQMKQEEILEQCQLFTEDVEKYKSIGVVNSGIIQKVDIDGNLINELEVLNLQIAELKANLKPLEDRKKVIETQFKKMIQNNQGIENDLYRITLGNRITSPTFEYKVSRSGLKIEYLK